MRVADAERAELLERHDVEAPRVAGHARQRLVVHQHEHAIARRAYVHLDGRAAVAHRGIEAGERVFRRIAGVRAVGDDLGHGYLGATG